MSSRTTSSVQNLPSKIDSATNGSKQTGNNKQRMKSKASKFKFLIADKTQQSSNHNIVIHLKKSAVVGWTNVGSM